MKHFTTRLSLAATALIGAVGLAAAPASALAGAKATSTNANTTTTKANTAKVALIIQRGDTEIERRLTSLNKLDSVISSASKLNSSSQGQADAASLTSEVNTEVNNLTTLKTKLDADTDVTTARADAQSIITDYRVYALITPKIYLVKTADDQQIAESKLSTLASALQTRLTSAQNSGKSVTTLETSLSDLNGKLSAAQTISAAIENGVITLQPTDYDSNHTVLSGDRDQLKTAQTDIQAALANAKTIVSGLKNL